MLQDPAISPLGAQTAVLAVASKLKNHYLGSQVYWEARMNTAITALTPSSSILKCVQRDIVAFVSY